MLFEGAKLQFFLQTGKQREYISKCRKKKSPRDYRLVVYIAFLFAGVGGVVEESGEGVVVGEGFDGFGHDRLT